MRLAGLVPGCPQFLPGKVLPCSDYPPLSLKGTEKAEAKAVQIACSGLPACSPDSCLLLSHPHHLSAVPSNWCVPGKAFEGKMVLQCLQPTLHSEQGPGPKGPQHKAKTGELYCHGGSWLQAGSFPIHAGHTNPAVLLAHHWPRCTTTHLLISIQMNQPALCNTDIKNHWGNVVFKTKFFNTLY